MGTVKIKDQEDSIKQLNEFLDGFLGISTEGDPLSKDIAFQDVIPQIINLKDSKMLLKLLGILGLSLPVTRDDQHLKKIKEVQDLKKNPGVFQKLEKFEEAMAREKVYEGVLGKMGIGSYFPQTALQYAKISRPVSQGFLDAINRASSKIAEATSEQATLSVDLDFDTPRNKRSEATEAGLGDRSTSRSKLTPSISR